MKKTSIALLALSSIVAADTITDPTWNKAYNADDSITWTTTLTGEYNFDLGDIAVTNGESFSMTVVYTADTWANSWGSGVISTGSLYDHQYGADGFRFYVGKEGTSNEQVNVEVNNWGYGMENVVFNTTEGMPLTFGIVFTWDSEAGTISMAPAEGSMVTWTPKTDSHIVGSFNISHLQNVGSVAVPSGTVTTISITKAPEPSAATLSLLALAGLAARRRR